MTFQTLAAATLAVITAASFVWGMQRFFATTGNARAERRWLMVSGYLWTFVEVTTILVVQPASPLLFATGIVLLLTALSTFWWSVLAWKGHQPFFAFSTDDSRVLLRHGPYRFVRHPFYSAYLLAHLSSVFITAQWWLLFFMVWAGAFYYRAASQEEEAFVRSEFADDYASYCRGTGMFVPWGFWRAGKSTEAEARAT